jgi:dihydroorotase
MARILIKNGRVWDGERFFNSDVLTDGEKIAKIEPDIHDTADWIYDAEGKTVSAGLVDMHVHMRVLPSDQFGIQAEMSCFPFGVTAVADAGRTRGDRTVIDSFMLKNLIFVNVHIQNNHPNFEKLEEALARFGDKAIGIKVYFDVNISEVSDITPLAQICRFARERGLRVMVHCSNSPTPMSEILNTLNEGDILTHAFHGGKNNAAEDAFVSMKEAQKRGVVIDSGFAGYVHTDFAVFRKAMENGFLPDTISTDITKFSAYTRGGRYGMTMCMSIARYMGMREEDIFRSVTSNPAVFLGKGQEWGCLRVGGNADIAVFDYTEEGFELTDNAGNHIESEKGYRCALTVSDGQVVYRH